MKKNQGGLRGRGLFLSAETHQRPRVRIEIGPKPAVSQMDRKLTCQHEWKVDSADQTLAVPDFGAHPVDLSAA
jgi:hypothetical protein